MMTSQEQATIHTGDKYLLVRSPTASSQRIGLYGKGGCDLKLIYACGPMLTPYVQGSLCFLTEGNAAESRLDIQLQTLEDLPQEACEEVRQRLALPADYFRPVVFEPTFKIQDGYGVEEFPKKVVFLSTGADVNRVAYRHAEYGFLVDPGGGWLNRSLELTLRDLAVVDWFRQKFIKVGRQSLEQFVQNLRRMVDIIRRRTNAHILVFNTLQVDPGGMDYNYQFVKNPHTMRRREFFMAMVEISRELDITLIDTDRVLKQAGTRGQVDFGHPTREFHPLIAREIARILRELGVV
jgi:hypothetical protein